MQQITPWNDIFYYAVVVRHTHKTQTFFSYKIESFAIKLVASRYMLLQQQQQQQQKENTVLILSCHVHILYVAIYPSYLVFCYREGDPLNPHVN